MSLDRYYACSSCARYVKRADLACPFCAASNAPPPPRAERVRTGSRSQWLAVGSTLAAVGCAGVHSSDSSRPDDAPALLPVGAADAESTARLDATVEGLLGDAQTKEASDVVGSDGMPNDASACGPPTGRFSCGRDADGAAIAVCDRSTEYCYQASAGFFCQPYDVPSLADAAACTTCPTCSCLAPLLKELTISPGMCSCAEDEAGAITIASCGPCYGAPPRRRAATSTT
jgi:hypothetical protein